MKQPFADCTLIYYTVGCVDEDVWLYLHVCRIYKTHTYITLIIYFFFLNKANTNVHHGHVCLDAELDPVTLRKEVVFLTTRLPRPILHFFIDHDTMYKLTKFVYNNLPESLLKLEKFGNMYQLPFLPVPSQEATTE